MKKKVNSIIFLIALTFGIVAVAPGIASAASYSVDMDIACKITLGVEGGRGTLAYPSQGAWGWRCYITPNINPLYSVNVQLYCDSIYGLDAIALDPSNPYSWRCQ